MLQQFQNILNEPPYTPQQILQSTRNLILNSLQSNFPPDFNFDGLAQLCNDPKISSNEPLLTYHLVDYYIQLMQNNFISVFNYESLEGQTQKLEGTIRSHIKLEQEVKMYLEHLEYKIGKYQGYLGRKEGLARQGIPSRVQTELRREKIGLVRNNQELKRRLEQKEMEIREKESVLEEKMKELSRFRQPKSDSIDGSAQLLKRSLKLANVRSELRLQPMPKLSRSVNKGEIVHHLSKVQRVESRVYSKLDSALSPPQDGQAMLINISGNNNEVNYYAGKSAR